uniref:D-aspartate oxidase-like isoform X1 n=2 Tax=Crassostrea virginica TaxID=6565 RepID=A0A8B8BA00_CRAVI|nr:D-aspartate oxidase-like isoform X1 [Crassostrea virginica]
MFTLEKNICRSHVHKCKTCINFHSRAAKEMDRNFRVAVVGAGAVGLSTALCIQDRIRNCDVTIIADQFSPSTTSDGSAGLWTPFLVPDDQREVVSRWALKTYHFLWDVFHSETACTYGVQLISGFNFCKEVQHDPPWSKQVKGFRRLSEEELKDYPGREYGIFYTAFTIDVPRLLSTFMKKFREQGGFVKAKKLGSLQEIESSFDVIVNCSGFGAAELLKDTKVKPKRGQVIRAKAPWIKHFYIDDIGDQKGDLTYILPGVDSVVLGGTSQDGNINTEDDQTDLDGIMKRCLKLMPSLKECKVQGTWAGLRPYREAVRLEIDRTSPGCKAKVVHNYGHGGSGLTLFWGCALDATELVLNLLQSKKSRL